MTSRRLPGRWPVAVDTAARLPKRRGRAVVAGAGLFLLSDAVLAASRFVRPLPGAEATVMVAYTAGLLSLELP